MYVNIHYGVCDGIFGEEGYPQITREGKAIRMRWYGDHWPEGSSELFCFHPTTTFIPPLGVYPPGDYTLTAERAHRDYSGIPSLLTIGVVPFTVAADPAPLSVPILGIPAALTLLAALSGLAMVSLRTQRAR